MNIDLFMSIITSSLTSGFIATQAIQFLKTKFNIKNNLIFAILEFVIGFLFALSFTTLGLVNSLWCGFVSIIGAEALYNTLKGKLGLKPSEN